jgi:2-oxoglutarate ferredoxin oxidoreductase subunit alpha
MPFIGDKKFLMRTTGSTHDEKGAFCPTPDNISRVTNYLTNKIEKNADDITITRTYHLEDADEVIITFGCCVRSAMTAVDRLRQEGIKAGLLQLVTIWPMAEKEICSVLSSVHKVVIPEMNMGQLANEIRKFNDYGCQIIQVNRNDGILITPQQIIDGLEAK